MPATATSTPTWCALPQNRSRRRLHSFCEVLSGLPGFAASRYRNLNCERRGFNLLEVVCALGLFAALSLIAVLCLRHVGQVWQRSSARDQAFRELQRAQLAMHRDLLNASRGANQSVFSPVQAGSGSVNTSDALAFVVPSPDQEDLKLSGGGTAVLQRLVTYYLAVPSNVDAQTGLTHTFAADADGYEDQCAYKWLIRKEEDAPAPAGPDQQPEVPPNWLASGVIEIPTQLWQEPGRRVVALNLLQMRVEQGPPLWQIRLTAVAVADARRKLAMGSVHLAPTTYAISAQVGVLAKN